MKPIQKLNLISIRCVLVYGCFGILLTFYLKQEEFALVVIDSFSERESEPPLYPDEQVGALYSLMKEGIFEDKRVGIWRPDSEAHDDSFSLMLAYTYFAPLSETITELASAQNAVGFDYIISPWEIASLESIGAELIHDEHWLFVYKNTQARNSQ